MLKRNPVNFSEPSHKSLKKRNMEEGMMDNDWDIDDCLVNFGISDDDLDLLLIEVTNGHHPSSAAKKAIEGVDQKGLVNLLTRIFAIAMKNRSVPKSLIPAAFDLISEILEISSPANSEPGETPILSACLKNLDKMSMSGEDWEKLPDILAGSYNRWGVTHCVGEILVKWLQVQSGKEEVNKDFGETVSGRGVKNCQVLLGKIGGRIRSDLPGRFLQLQQMARKLLLAEDCRDREQLLGIVITLSALNQREAVGHTEEETKLEKVQGQVNLEIKKEEEEDDENLNDSDEEQTGEFFSLAELERSKQKSEENKAPCKTRLISPSQFEDFVMEDSEKNVDDVNNNKSIEWPIDTNTRSECILEIEKGEKLPKRENPFHPGLEMGMANLDISDADDKPQSPKLIPNNISKIVNDSPTIKAKNDNVPKAPELLGYLKSLDSLKGKKSSAHSVTSGCSVGRHPSCRVTLEGPKVSRVHATIFKTVDGIFLQTVSKTNSCCVNGNLIGTDKFIRIVTGDKVEIGGIQFVWMENGGNGENVLNKVEKEESGTKMSQEQMKFKNLTESTIKKNKGGSTNVKAVLNGKGDKKIKPKLNVAAILEANLKKMENYAPSDEASSNTVKIPDVTIKLPDMSIPPPSLINKEIVENSKQTTKHAGGQNIFRSKSSVSPVNRASKHCLPDFTVPPPTFSLEKGKDEAPRFGPKVPPLFTSPEYRSLSGEPLQLKENRPPKYPNVTIPPPIMENPIKKGKKNNVKNGTPKTERNSGIQFHTQMPNKNMLKSKKSSSALGAKRSIPPSLDTVVPSVNGTGQLGNTCQDKTDSFKIGISKKIIDSSVNDRDSFPVKTTNKMQESDDVVIESERFITDD